MVQRQSQFAGERKEDRKIWYTYHWSALKAAREAVSLDSVLKDKIRRGQTDRGLVCARKRNKHPTCFSKSLVAIVLCVFTIEYRVSRVAQDEGIWKKEINECFNEDGDRILLCEPKEFNELSLYLKWRNIVEVLGKTLKPEFRESVEKLRYWITLRNKIAHGEHKQILKFQISPKQARSCYDEITEAIFGLNTALCYGTRGENRKTCKDMLL